MSSPQENNKTWKYYDYVRVPRGSKRVTAEFGGILYEGQFVNLEEIIFQALDTQRNEKNEQIAKYFKELPWGQSGNKDYDRGWDECKRNDKSSVLTLIQNK